MKKCYILMFILFLNACSLKKIDIPIDKEGCNIINIPLHTTDNIINLSTLVDSLAYIPLETDSNCLIGNIDKLLVLKDRFLVLDKDISCAIYSFDKNGKFINRIGKRGVGSEEYVSITDIAIDSSEKEIYLLDSDMNRFAIYSLDGNFIKSVPFNYIVEAIACVDYRKIACFCDYAKNNDFIYADKCPNLLIYDMEKHSFEKGLYFDISLCRSGITTLNNNFTNNSNLIQPLNDTIYTVSSQGIKYKYILDFGDDNRKEKEKYMRRLREEIVDSSEAMQMIGENALFPSLLYFLQGEDINFFFYRKRFNFYYGFYYPQSGTYIEASQKYTQNKKSTIPIVNDIDQTFPFIPLTVAKNNFYYILEPSLFDSFGKSSNKNVNELKQKITPEDNPVIVEASMKIY